jgi:hypothetical protein
MIIYVVYRSYCHFSSVICYDGSVNFIQLLSSLKRQFHSTSILFVHRTPRLPSVLRTHFAQYVIHGDSVSLSFSSRRADDPVLSRDEHAISL